MGKHVLMIDNYDSFTWNLYQFLNQSKNCSKVDVYRNDKIDIATIEEMSPDIIFISPGPGHPSTDAGISKEVIDHFKGRLPIVGVCMGLQCMFEVFGGEVSYAGEIVHGKTTTIKHDSKGMFSGVPQSVAVTRYHSLAGTLKSLPDCLQVTATTETQPEIIMGVRHKEYTIEGVQFHPESILTESGQIMIDNILNIEGGRWVDKPKKSGKKNILEEIYTQRKEDYKEIEQLPGKSFEELEIYLANGLAPPLVNFYQRLKHTKDDGKNIILSEFKRASPSKGIINIKANPVTQSLTYAHNGCSTISVLTEPKWFKGSLDDLKTIRTAIDKVPNRPAVLRKEFIFNKYQILESRLSGADTVLLIVKMLEPKLLSELYNYSLSLGMNPLVEINNDEELKVALTLESSEPLILGINNRNLVSFDVDLNTTTNLLSDIRNSGREIIVLALSGITSTKDIIDYKKDKVDGFLIGESLMRAEERGEADSFLKQLCDC
ncbi:multifunctional tryptophan biosynthesis protein [[Candida] jaroonii]|uniref:Multifunctional tryptophan biosynthesis protein n=1 Tax=[Candida] jaroonii TaxID=467808 RepID=A0ACA9Y1N0_9ASCO|nr:multifunctional tryptophan biosynthesis protein [[Candida] jaroonii]